LFSFERKQGLRIAPPEAPSTGYMFGKGVKKTLFPFFFVQIKLKTIFRRFISLIRRQSRRIIVTHRVRSRSVSWRCVKWRSAICCLCETWKIFYFLFVLI